MLKWPYSNAVKNIVANLSQSSVKTAIYLNDAEENAEMNEKIKNTGWCRAAAMPYSQLRDVTCEIW